MSAYTGQPVSFLSLNMSLGTGLPTDGSKNDKSNRRCHHGLARSYHLLVEPVEGIGAGLDLADSCPTEVETREEDDAQCVRTNSLHGG